MLGFGLYFSNIKPIAKLSDPIKNRKVPVDFQEKSLLVNCTIFYLRTIFVCYFSSINFIFPYLS